MSYQVLARKWRPQGFDEVVGQAHVTTPLRNAIRSGRVPHAILLTGPRGTGKTTLARILARCLNCEKGPTDTPCSECIPCTEIVAGTSTDVQEVDAASRTGVDDVRELIEAIRYAPTPGKHRIFVVDEVHMLSKAAFNALLKTLEEPPPNSLFLFATTNPEAIPFTVVSRCQRYDLRRIAAAEIAERLAVMARAEKLAISDKSLLAIAREADGSMRDSQTLLDQVIAFGGSEVSDEQVAEVLDLVDRRLLLGAIEACVDGDAARALEACGRASEAGVDAKRFGENLLSLLRDLVVLRVSPDGNLVEGSDDEIAELRQLAGRTEEARLRRMFRALVKEQEDLAWAPRPFAVLEMALVRLATLANGDDVATLLARLDALERRLSSGSGPSGGNGGASPAARGSGGAGSRSGGSRAAPAEAAPPTEPAPAVRAPEPPHPAEAGGEPPQQLAPPADLGAREEPSSGAHPEGAPLPVVFDRLRGFAGKDNPGLYAAMDGGRLLDSPGDVVRIAVPRAFSAQRLQARRDALEAACARFFGRPVGLEIQSDGEATAGGAPPARRNPEQVRQVRKEALNHPALDTMLEVFEGEVVEIRPLREGR